MSERNIKLDLVEAANTQTQVSITGSQTGNRYLTTEFTYGVLVPDENHPLSNVSVANSSLSIDPWVGCKWQCAYCHVQGSNQDLAENNAMPRDPRRRSAHTIQEIIDELVEHPFFVPDETVISIGTASTEPLAQGPVIDSTLEIMDTMIHKGLQNPFWIVTKRGVPKGLGSKIERVVGATKGLMISLCWADNPKNIEPVQNNRFKYADEAQTAGATLAWYMRPLSPSWSGTPEKVEQMMQWMQGRYDHLLSAIVPGGLRWSEGIEHGMTEIRGLPKPAVSELNDNQKDLPLDLARTILELSKVYLPDLPVYFKSSCALTHMLGVASITSVSAQSRFECETSICPDEQRSICANGRIHTMDIHQAQEVVDRLRIPLQVRGWTEKREPITRPSLSDQTYAIKQTVLNNLERGVK